jgi:hypothetical protein
VLLSAAKLVPPMVASAHSRTLEIGRIRGGVGRQSGVTAGMTREEFRDSAKFFAPCNLPRTRLSAILADGESPCGHRAVTPWEDAMNKARSVKGLGRRSDARGFRAALRRAIRGDGARRHDAGRSPGAGKCRRRGRAGDGSRAHGSVVTQGREPVAIITSMDLLRGVAELS